MDRGISLLLTQLLSEIFELAENENHIQTGILSGSLCLENLVIKKSLFDDEKAPITLSHGSIGKIQIRFPWSNLGNEPIQVLVENIFILCKPQYKRDSMEMKLRREHRRKRALLGTLTLSQATAKQKSTTESAEKSKSLPSFQYFTRFIAEKMIRSILSNLEIQVKNFHFRYEDQISCSSEFAIGFTLESFLLQSINQSAANSSFGILFSLFSASNTKPIYQRCTIDSVSVYLNQMVANSSSSTDTSAANAGTTEIGFISFADKTTPEILMLMERSIPTKYRRAHEDVVLRGGKHEYLIQPFHTSCEIEISLGTYDDSGNLLTNDIQVCLK
jgi:vacuolar protein sorting-associated protein 13A/C